MLQPAILSVNDLRKHFPLEKGFLSFKKSKSVKAVDGISFEMQKGETLGLVGESGCGKTTVGRLILRLIEATGGEIRFEGHNIQSYSGPKIRSLRKNMQIIFQDPYSSLNPMMTVERIVAEPMETHQLYHRKEREQKVLDLLESVGLRRYHAKRFPHEFSGGQRQRIGIARCLALNPKIIICDEPVSALDVSIQAQIINLLKNLQDQFGFTYLMISHDLSIIKHMCDRIAVMYLGKIVELTDKHELYRNPKHPYTQALLSAIPLPDPRKRIKRIMLKGDVPSPINPPEGCRFQPRCRHRIEICKQKEPLYVEIEKGHFCACHLNGQTE